MNIGAGYATDNCRRSSHEATTHTKNGFNVVVRPVWAAAASVSLGLPLTARLYPLQ